MEFIIFIVLIALIVIVFLFIDGVLALEFSNIAEVKGWHSSKYFWYAFLFGIVGYLFVIALPDLSQQK